MRESLFEQLKNRELSFVEELKKITILLQEGFTDAHLFYSGAFKNSPYNVFFVDFDRAMFDIFENKSGRYPNGCDGVGDLIDSTIRIGDDLTLDSFLNYLEFFRSLFEYGVSHRCDSNAKQIFLIVNNDCERIGYAFVREEDRNTYKTMLKHPVAESVATIVKESIKTKIYRYLMIRGGNIDGKRECIKSLADDVEITCKKYSNIDEYDKLKQFIQCTRHTKDKPKKEFPFYYEDEEQWLDKTFDMIIGVLSFTKTKEIVAEIKGLENARNPK